MEKIILHSKEVLLQKLRGVPVNTGERVYENSFIDLVRMPISLIKFSQKYVIGSRVADILNLKGKLQESFGLEKFNGYLSIYSNGEYLYDFLPPVVEWSSEDCCWLLNDGMHRIYADYLTGKNFVTVVRVQHVLKGFPYYAYPCNLKWDQVKSLSAKPSAEDNKQYRREGAAYKELFRRFDKVFHNIQMKRPDGLKCEEVEVKRGLSSGIYSAE